ncbi:hypothetical protein [Ekhidna sp.]|uniref:cytidylyltransferase domain-containing protein n=1 Tax=Ekhidna sp. TaxID=2608089 RepID=UPI003296C1CA
MNKVVACIIARTVSTRLPLKIFRDLREGESMIEFLIDRVKSVDAIDEIYLCTSKEPVDDIMEDVAKRKNIKLYRGSANQVIERMLMVGEVEDAEIVIRITGDNPFTAIDYLPHQINFLREEQLDYTRLVRVPVGATAEVIRLSALKKCYEIMDPEVSEYMMLFLFEPKTFKCGIVTLTSEDYSHYSLTVDTPKDLERTRIYLDKIGGKKASDITLLELIEIAADQENVQNFDDETPVKMPYDKLITFAEFKSDMDRRLSDSLKLELNV